MYRALDRLHPQRATIERALADRERTLFNLDDTIYLYDLPSTYFEGQCPQNPQAKRGYSPDHRPDCKQVASGWCPYLSELREYQAMPGKITNITDRFGT